MDRVDTPPPGMVPPGMGGGPLPGMSAPPGTSVSFAEPPGESKLLALERTLAAKDAVMEPEVLATLRDYVANGGKPAAAIELLSEADESTTGRASFTVADPDGNPILVDQHV